jgi:phage terminase large subunit GpA-like protein
MDCLSDPEVTEVVIQKSARVGYTEGVIGNGVGYFVDQDPSPILIIQPTESDAEDWSRRQLEPLLRDTPCLAEIFPESRGRNAKNTILSKYFPGGSITVRGGHSPRGLRRINARVVFFDEVSALVASAGQSGDPVKLGETRADTFPDRKIVKGSTPLVKGLCRITKDFERSDQRHFHVPCPHCDHAQTLKWGDPDSTYGIKWDRDGVCKHCQAEITEDGPCTSCGSRERETVHRPETTYYLCEQCASPIDERQKPEMVRRGRWVAKYPERKVRGYHLNALYSLISDRARWPALVQEFLDAAGDPVLLQVFVNEVLGEAWEEKGEQAKTDGLADRVEDYRGPQDEPVDVPHGVGLLTAGVDVQNNWVELLVVGWGAGEESWRIAHHRIYGDPLTAELWARVEPLLVKPYSHASGADLRIRRAAIDSGFASDSVYSFVLSRQERGVYAVQGIGGAGKPPTSRARKVGRDGVELYMVGVETLKDTLFSRLRRSRPGPGYRHFATPRPERYNGFDAEYYAQLGAERKVRRRKRGSRETVLEYVKIRERNEAIDLEVYALAALHLLGAGVRGELGALPKQVREAGPKWREVYKEAPAARRKKGRRVISQGLGRPGG